MKHLKVLLFVWLCFLAFVAAAFAAKAHVILPSKQLWTIVIGALVPLFTYVINHVGPWVSEAVKATVLVVVSAIASALYEGIATSSFGWNSTTLQFVASGVLAALLAHKLLWQPSGISTLLGAGSNAKHPAKPAHASHAALK